MIYYYSPSELAFYPEDLLPIYGGKDKLPKDVVPLTQEQYDEAYAAITSGHTVSGGGKVEAVEYKEDLPRMERAWRDSELLFADVELLKVQDSDPNATGSVGDWRQYRRELRAWPKHKDFPNKGARPKAPTAE